MTLYNVTVKVDANIAADWILWMKAEHIPAVLATECFEEAKMYRLLEIDDSEGPTFSIQYFAANKENYQRYIDTFATPMRNETHAKWGNKYIAFRSLMQPESLK